MKLRKAGIVAGAIVLASGALLGSEVAVAKTVNQPKTVYVKVTATPKATPTHSAKISRIVTAPPSQVNAPVPSPSAVIPTPETAPDSVNLAWHCTPNESADTYSLSLTNTSDQSVTVTLAEVGIFGSDGTEIGTDTPAGTMAIATGTTYDYTGQLWTSLLSGTAASCQLLSWND